MDLAKVQDTLYGAGLRVRPLCSACCPDLRIWGTVNGSLLAFPHLRANAGALINVGSEAPETPVPLHGTCTASKHAVKGFTANAMRLKPNDNHASQSVLLSEAFQLAVDPALPVGRWQCTRGRAPTP